MATSSEIGVIVRKVDDDLAYALVEGTRPRSVAFGPAVVPDFAGRTLSELGVEEGTVVSLVVDPRSGVVQSAVPGARRPDRRRSATAGTGGATPLPRSVPSPAGETTQLELLPSDTPDGAISVSRALPPATRSFGKLIDTSALKPGDLMLSRDLNPEWTGRAIVSVQVKGGYAEPDARWTHAAMYVGDGAHVVEATFDSPMSGGSVRLTGLDDYCKGEAAVRFRRSSFLETDEDRWRLCVRALKRLHRPYSFGKAIEMWFRVAIGGSGFFDEDQKYSVSDAVICSTLYADAYNETTRRSLGEIGGACVPAWLSVSDEFTDVQTRWLKF